METLEKRIRIMRLLTIAMIVNIAVAAYIYIQEKGISIAGDSCFANTSAGLGSCAQVQSSIFGSLFGVPVSIYGVIAFAFMALASWSYGHSLRHGKPIPHIEHAEFERYLSMAFILGAIFAAIFIILQFTVIGAICEYCLITDSITIVSAALFIVTFKRR